LGRAKNENTKLVYPLRKGELAIWKNKYRKFKTATAVFLFIYSVILIGGF